MNARTITILDPVSRPIMELAGNTARPKSTVGLRVGMLDNTKPNFDFFCNRVEEHLLEQFGVAVVNRYVKKGRTFPVEPEMLEDIKKNCDIVICGLGD